MGLTKFSIIELEQEADQLRSEIAELEKLLNSEQLIRNQVSRELEEVSEAFGDARRTELIDSEGAVVSRKPVQVSEIEDTPVVVVLSPTGIIYRCGEAAEGDVGRIIPTSTRADVGFVTASGRAVRVHVSDLPTKTPGVSGQLPDATSFLGLERDHVIAVIPWSSTDTYALGTKQGVVKRFEGSLPDRDEVEVISLKDFDEVLGVYPAPDSTKLMFVSAEANLLVFDASAVRPQGLPATGMAGINLGDSRALFFGVSNGGEFLVTAANSSQALGATDPGSVKTTSLAAFPQKGRATQGVRCQRFLKSEDQLYFAGLAALPVVVDHDGNQLAMPEVDERRDASGKPASGYLAACY